MKTKICFPAVLCLLIGFFMCNYTYNEYKKTDKTSITGANLYFLQAGVFSSIESMKKEMSNSSYYIYTMEDNMYHSYVGIVKNEKNLKKLKDFFNSEGYDIYVRQMFVTDISFLTLLDQYELMLESEQDKKVIKSICNQILSKYEEYENNDNN